MKHILNFGSLNIDHVYQVDHVVRPGETLSCSAYQQFAGGKGFNQTIALARAGLRVTHAGRIGNNGVWLRERLAAESVDVSSLQVTSDVPTGHATIQVVPGGENAILIHGGANQTLDETFVEQAFDKAADVDLVLLQNETNAIAHVLSVAHRRGLPVAFNPAPFRQINGKQVNQATNCDVRAGKIGLQSEGGEIHFRTVNVLPLGEKRR